MIFRSRSFITVLIVSLVSTSVFADRSKKRTQGRFGTNWNCRTTVSEATFHKMAISDVWKSYARVKSIETRNWLMERYLPLVEYHADVIHSRLPPEVDIGDLMAFGVFGLADAIDSFDLKRGVKFETFSARRIRGSILDGLREMDLAPRLVRDRQKTYSGIFDAEFKSTGHRSSPEEIFTKLVERNLKQGMSEEMALKVAQQSFSDARQADATRSIPLQRKVFDSERRDIIETDLIAAKSDGNIRHFEDDESLRHRLATFTRAERLIIFLYYGEELSMKEIGSALELCESRVSQMHKSLLMRLKASTPRSEVSGRHPRIASAQE